MLVVPECQFNSRIPLLVGTNVLLPLFEHALEQGGPEKGSITIAPKQKYWVMGDVRPKRRSQGTPFVLEPHEHHGLPGGLFLEPALIDISFRPSSKVPVALCNLSEHSVTLQPKCIIAQICAAQHIIPLGLEQSVSHQDKPDSDNLDFNLADSPISEQDKECIINKLKSIPEVFARDGLSHGHTTAVWHHIRLKDDTPFKERPRPIHPRDREHSDNTSRNYLTWELSKSRRAPSHHQLSWCGKRTARSGSALIAGS